jgi:hypothetical protein
MTVWKRPTFELEQAGLQVNCAGYDKSGRFRDKDQIYQTYMCKLTDIGTAHMRLRAFIDLIFPPFASA